MTIRNLMVVTLLLLTACRYFPVAPAQDPTDVKKTSRHTR
jgi:hypothetical protein